LGYEDGPWKVRGHLCWWPLIFKEFDFIVKASAKFSANPV